jgi:hypothetical protein
MDVPEMGARQLIGYFDQFCGRMAQEGAMLLLSCNSGCGANTAGQECAS